MGGSRLILALAVFGAIAAHALGGDWPQWRGPTRDGAAQAATLPMPWPKALRQVWQVEVGEGHSSPVVAGGKVVVLARQAGREVVLCLNSQDGKEIWRDAYPASFTPVPVARAHRQGPFATPTIADGRVFTLGVTGALSCYELGSGKRVWRHDFAGQFNKTFPLYGAACSPLIDGRLCIVGIGGRNDGALAAFDKNTGKLVWQYRGDGPAYASPIAADLAGRRQVVTFMQTRLVGVAADSGLLLWQVPFETPYEMNIVTPVIWGDKVIYSGCRRGIHAVQIVNKDGKIAAEPVWSNPNFSIFMSSPVLDGDRLFGVCQRGYRRGAVACLDLNAGKQLWAGPPSPSYFYASIIKVGRKLLVCDSGGELLVVKASPNSYRQLGRCRVSKHPVWAHIALAGGRLYVKGRRALTCFDLAEE